MIPAGHAVIVVKKQDLISARLDTKEPAPETVDELVNKLLCLKHEQQMGLLSEVLLTKPKLAAAARVELKVRHKKEAARVRSKMYREMQKRCPIAAARRTAALAARRAARASAVAERASAVAERASVVAERATASATRDTASSGRGASSSGGGTSNNEPLPPCSDVVKSNVVGDISGSDRHSDAGSDETIGVGEYCGVCLMGWEDDGRWSVQDELITE